MRFELTKEFIQLLRTKIAEQDLSWIHENVLELHHAEVAEIIDTLTNDEARYVYFLVDEETQADILMELDEEIRDRFLASLSSKEIAPLMNISFRSVELHRYRLRKKLGLNQDKNLTKFLLEI